MPTMFAPTTITSATLYDIKDLLLGASYARKQAYIKQASSVRSVSFCDVRVLNGRLMVLTLLKGEWLLVSDSDVLSVQ